jgi:hypothetical protein
MPDNDPTLGELMRRLDRMERSIDARLDSLVAAQVYDRDLAVLRGRIDTVEESMRWLRRQIISAVIPIIVGAVVLVIASGR